MTVTGISSRSAITVQSLINMRAQLDDLQRQLGTGRKSDTYAGLGINRGLTVSVNSQLAAMKSFNNSILQVDVRLGLAQTSLSQIDTLSRETKNAASKSTYNPDGTGQTSEQRVADDQLELILGLLNTTAGERYIFSGLDTDKRPVETLEHILEGDGSRAGLKQMISERRQADLGANGLGRLDIPAAVGATVEINEDTPGSPFGMKLAGVNSTLTGATVTGPTAGQLSVDLGATNPAAGETIKVSFALPDGTTKDITLTATAADPAGPNEFSIGANTGATATNLQAALTTAVGQVAASDLTAASALTAGDAFFAGDLSNPPMRVDGPPFDSATGMVAGTDANSVIWYKGEAGTNPARSTASVRIDTSISVDYGMRANEESLQNTMRNIAVFAAVSYSSTDPNAEAGYKALKDRVSENLADEPGRQKISDIQSEIAGTQSAIVAAKSRHRQTESTLKDLMGSIAGISEEEVGAKILSLQTSLQASLQTTAMLLRTSIINYL